MITQEELKQEMRYDPDTGEFWWVRQNWKNNRRMSSPVGTISPLGYKVVGLNNKTRTLHRLAWLYMTGELPISTIDHINGNPADNRWINLRSASIAENNQNLAKKNTNKSGFPGVSWDKKTRKWHAQICSIKQINLGYYKDPLEAYFVYWLAKQKLHTFNPSVRITGYTKSAANPA